MGASRRRTDPRARRVRPKPRAAAGWDEAVAGRSTPEGGRPCICGLRITVHDILEDLTEGTSEDEILHDFPDLEREDIRAALAFADEECGLSPDPVAAGSDWSMVEQLGQVRRRPDGRRDVAFGRAGKAYSSRGAPFRDERDARARGGGRAERRLPRGVDRQARFLRRAPRRRGPRRRRSAATWIPSGSGARSAEKVPDQTKDSWWRRRASNPA
ncbi:DUF433 domain-containing protein [Myxococcota bacterium]|nr:DUF433 domain-containing protein [Myxococcota bacterium]